MTSQQAALTRMAQHHIDLVAAYDASIPLVREYDPGLQLSHTRDECLRSARELSEELVRIGGFPVEIDASLVPPSSLGFRPDTAPDAALRALRQFERLTIAELQELLATPFDPRTRELLNRQVGSAEDRARRLDAMILRRQAEQRAEVQVHATT